MLQMQRTIDIPDSQHHFAVLSGRRPVGNEGTTGQTHCAPAIGSIPLQPGYPLHPQNGPRALVRSFIGR